METTPEGRSERVDLRLTPAAKQFLQQAAQVTQQSLTEFLLANGMKAAHATLADRRAFMLSEQNWNAFLSALDAPPADNPALRALLARKPAWEL